MRSDHDIVDLMVKAGMLVTNGQDQYDIAPAFASRLYGRSRTGFIQWCCLTYLKGIAPEQAPESELLLVAKIVGGFIEPPAREVAS
jgi:hypothetical protein